MYARSFEATASARVTIQNRMKELACHRPHSSARRAIGEEKRAFLMQLFADVMGQSWRSRLRADVRWARQSSRGWWQDRRRGLRCAEDAQAKMTGVKMSSTGEPRAHAIYQELYPLYLQVHDAFGVAGSGADVSGVMKKAAGHQAEGILTLIVGGASSPDGSRYARHSCRAIGGWKPLPRLLYTQRS